MKLSLAEMSNTSLSLHVLFSKSIEMGTVLLQVVGPFVLTALLLGVIVNLLQTGFLLSTQALVPDFNRINPLNGAKRFVSSRGLVEVVKSLGKLGIIGWIGYSTVSNGYAEILAATRREPLYVTSQIGVIRSKLPQPDGHGGHRLGFSFRILSRGDKNLSQALVRDDAIQLILPGLAPQIESAAIEFLRAPQIGQRNFDLGEIFHVRDGLFQSDHSFEQRIGRREAPRGAVYRGQSTQRSHRLVLVQRLLEQRFGLLPMALVQGLLPGLGSLSKRRTKKDRPESRQKRRAY